MVISQLEEKYIKVPLELKQLKRWVGYRIEEIENGKTTKRPYNVLTGARAKVNDNLTWSTFNLALSGCIKYNFDGIGFVLGDGIFGVDLDNHPNADGNLELAEDEFKKLANEFVASLNSYTEWSQSGNGIHIICKGKLPEGSRRKSGVEMYDTNRFFVFTGNAIRNIGINERSEEVKPLWEKYVYTPIVEHVSIYSRPTNSSYEELDLSDAEVIEYALSSRQADDFYRYYHNGDVSRNGNDQSAADMAFCNMLAFWCNKDKGQMDRIFRSSALMRDKWDQHRGLRTYGEITINTACNNIHEGFVKTKLIDRVTVANKSVVKEQEPQIAQISTETPNANTLSKQEVQMNLDANGEPIFRIKQVYGHYPYSDTGNAMKFYDYFGDLFKYNATDKVYMFWTGKTWVKDSTQIIRKYANKFIEILKNDEKIIENDIAELNRNGKVTEAKEKEKLLDACQKNTARVANKAGKDAMLTELQGIKDISITSDCFDNDLYLLNTDSGIVDLRTGNLSAFDKSKLMTKNTNTQVSFERSEVWEKFLWSIFDNGNAVDTQEMIDSLQTCLGYSLSGTVREQVMFLLYGNGSNGKSTLTETIAHVMGSYADNVSSSILMQQKGSNNSMFSIAKLQGSRFVETGETDDGGKLNEQQVKILTGDDQIAAQFKFGNEFSFKPKFKIWMSTNNPPVIRGTDYGIWRRVFMFPFLRSFTDDEKDKDLPQKLRADADKILGWCIKGYLKYQELNKLIMPAKIKEAVKEYKMKMDVVAQFIDKKCVLGTTYKIPCEDLYEAYKSWGGNNTEFVMKESKFSEDLKSKGVMLKKDSTGIYYYYGIRMAGVYVGK